MQLYEHIFMVRQDASNAQVDALTQQFQQIVADNDGAIGKTEYWGVKPLAYRIRKNRKAHFTLMNITAPHAAVAEMERQMRISDDVIRFLTIRVDEHEEGPSAMTRRGGRDDRGDRGPRGPRGDARGGGDKPGRSDKPGKSDGEDKS